MDRDGIEAYILSAKIIEAIWDDLLDRSGIDHIFMSMDGYVFKDISDSLRERVKDVLAEYG